MKRLIALLLVLTMALSLWACGGGSAEDTTEESTTETTVEETTEETTPPVKYRHPLTGAPLESPWTGRAMAVSMNNAKDALPQSGITQADILYEFECEGSVTRRLAIFSDLSKVGVVGPVRSVRTYFSNVAVSYDAPVAHCGGSTYAMRAQYDTSGDTIANWMHIDEMYNSSYFFRDKDRYNYQGYAWEHTLFTTGEQLAAAMEAKGYNTVNENGTDYGLQFADLPQWTGETCKDMTITFRGKKTTTASYDAELGRYKIGQFGSVGVDAGTGKDYAVRNVLVLFADQSKIGVHSFYDLIGSGEGYLACNGQIVPITWTRESLRKTFTYTLADGTPAVLGVGNSYIAVIEGTVDYQ